MILQVSIERKRADKQLDLHLVATSTHERLYL